MELRCDRCGEILGWMYGNQPHEWVECNACHEETINEEQDERK